MNVLTLSSITPARYVIRSGFLRAFPALFALVSVGWVRAQDHTIVFSTTDPGVRRAITNWGLDTGWANRDNMQRGLIFMGTNNVNVVQVAFEMNAPLTNNDLTPGQKADLLTMSNLATMATSATRWNLSSGTGAGVDASYQSGAGTVYPDRWAAAMQAWQRNYRKTFWVVQAFNEPDWGWGQGSPQNLFDILGYLRAATNFAGSALGGPCTLDCGQASSWFNVISNRVSVGTTHCLNGSVASYVGFLQSVAGINALPFNPEAHNLGEAIVGANYGLQGVIWWGTAETARGSFVNACQGTRLGYADDWANWTVAAVYRGADGAVQAFLGGDERHGAPTTYRFFAKDRDVFYNGDGPRRDFTVTNPGYEEAVVNISWGADVQPAIRGRYIVVNRKSGLALEVPGASTNNGTVLDQRTYTGASNQLWDVFPLPNDLTYFTMTAAHDGVTADLNNWFYANEAVIQQWNGGTNLLEQWYFQYTTNGYFKIRNRWSGKVAGVYGASTSSGAQIVQWDDNGSPDQQWRFIPAAPGYDLVAPAIVTGVTAAASACSLLLNWTASTAPDLAGYTVLRSTTNGGPYQVVARGLTTHSFTDNFANQSRDYYYVVKAMDRSLNLSDNSLQVSARPTGTPALIARYSFDGNANDSSGNANHPIVTNGTLTFTGGRYSQGLNLNGADQYLMLPANLMASVTNFTLAAWVNWSGGAAWQRVFDFGNDTTQYLFLTPSSASGTLRFAITTNSAGGEQILESSPLPIGQWQHVAVTRNGTTAKLFTNGVLAASASVGVAPASFNPALNYLGRSQWPDPLFGGRLDEVFLYNYALSDTETVRLMNNLPPPPVAPTALVTSLTGSTLNLSWPSNYLGCRLESNSASLIAPGSWFTVSSSAATNMMFVPVVAARSNVFFRLVYP